MPDLTQPNLFVTIPMSEGDLNMNIPSRRSSGFRMSKQSRSQLINWLKDYDQQAHEALNYSPEEAVAIEATNVLGEQITGGQIRYYCKQQGLGTETADGPMPVAMPIHNKCLPEH